MKCLLCKKRIPNERITARTKYCSELCNKRSYYLRKTPPKICSFMKKTNTLNSCTQKGLFWERFISKKLGIECLSDKRMNQYTDIVWNGFNIDIKSSNLHKRKMKKSKPVKQTIGQWIFNRNKFKEKIDFFICICLINNKPFKFYKIPQNEFPKTGITIGHKSKYDEYLFNIS